jgi:hypothetical protein
MWDFRKNTVTGSEGSATATTATETDPLLVQGQRVGRAFGRLILTLAVVWALTMIAAAVAAKASPEFIWVLLILIVGASGSGACVEAARRQAMPRRGSQD